MENNRIDIVAVKKHSKFIKSIYILCIALICLGLLVLVMQMSSSKKSYEGEDVIVANSSEMIKPQYKGKTDDNSEYLIISNKAKEIKDGIVLLNSPVANLSDENSQNNFILDSLSGIYDDNKKILTLTDGVKLNDGDGNQFYSSKVQMDLQKNIIYSNNKIDLEGKVGKIRAEDGFEIRDNGDVLIFKGKTNLYIEEVKKDN